MRCYCSQLKVVLGDWNVSTNGVAKQQAPCLLWHFRVVLLCASSLRPSPICSVHRPMFKPRQRRSSVESDVFASDEEDMRSSPAQHNPAQLSVIDQWADQDPFSSQSHASAVPVSVQGSRPQTAESFYTSVSRNQRREANTYAEDQRPERESRVEHGATAVPTRTTRPTVPTSKLRDPGSVLAGDKLDRLKTLAYRRAHEVPPMDTTTATTCANSHSSSNCNGAEYHDIRFQASTTPPALHSHIHISSHTDPSSAHGSRSPCPRHTQAK